MKLLELSRTQEWLISEMKKDTGLFVDSSLLYKILTGYSNSPRLTASIEKILNIKK